MRKFSSAILLSFLVLTAAVPLAAAEPLQVRLKPDVAELLSGTRYQAEIHAYYSFFDKKAKEQNADALMQHAIASEQVYRADFTAPLDPRKPLAPFVFQFPKTPPAPTPAYMPAVVFKVKLTVSPPKSSGLPSVTNEQEYVSIVVAPGVLERCFRIRGPVLDGFFYVGIADCAQPVMKRPAGKDHP